MKAAILDHEEGAIIRPRTNPYTIEWIHAFQASMGIKVPGFKAKKARKAKVRTMPQILDSAHLYYQKGTSDKEYEIFFEQEGTTYIVRANYGRRGSVLKPVEKYRGRNRADAQEAFNKLFDEKTAKGYERREVRQVTLRDAWDTIFNDMQPGTALVIGKKKATAKKPANKDVVEVKSKLAEKKPDRNIVLGDL